MDNDKKCCCWSKAWRFGLFVVALYVIYFIWLWINPEKTMHLQMMRECFLWFSGINFWSFVLGLIESFISGLIVFGLFKLIMGGCCCKDGKCEK